MIEFYLHALFINSKKGYHVKSYGTGSVVKLPGPGPNSPNVYSFGTTYEEMYQDLYKKDPHLYPNFRSIIESDAKRVEQWSLKAKRDVGIFVPCCVFGFLCC